jgi:glycosyltransferase involved in cell wall biosynthesis
LKTAVYDHRIFSQQEFGGVSRYFCELAARIGQRPEWRALVVAPFYYNRYLAESSVDTVGVFVPLAHRRLKKLYAWGNKLAARPLMACNTPTVLHHTYFSPRPFAAKAPSIVTVYDMIHELYPQYFPAQDPTRAWKRANVAAADHVICISHSTARDLERLLGISCSKISVVHLSYSDIFRVPGPAPADRMTPQSRPFFLFVGTRDTYKNFLRLLEAFAASPRLLRDFDLVAFGGGRFTPVEAAKISDAGFRDHAVRQVSGDDSALARYYAAAHAFVYPSEYEGFGIPPLEAMACGCPVACSTSSSLPEVVGAAAEFFVSTEVESMTSALERIAYDEVRRTELIQEGRKQCKRYSWDRCADETAMIYDRLL